MKNLSLLLLLLLILPACNNRNSEDATSQEAHSEASSESLPALSIYHLPATWTNLEGQQLQLEELKGSVLVMVMIYTQCKAACPRLVADMRNLESKIAEEDLDKLKFVLVSIDPEYDTPDRMKAFAKENRMEEDHWLFLRGDEETTMEFAAVLAVNYKRISPIDFTHSNIISVFDEEGVLVHQREGLGVDNGETLTAIQEEVSEL